MAMGKLWIAMILLLAVGIVCGDNPMLQGDQLKAEQDPEVRWDESSQQYQIRLTCSFSKILDPSHLNITWITPEGEAKISSGYSDLGHFYLSLLTPLRGGTYTCTLSPARPSEEHGDHNITSVSAHVIVDELKARLSLLEANQKSLRTNYNRLEGKLQNVERTHMADMENVTAYCEDTQKLVEQQMEDLKTTQQFLLNNMQSPKNRSHSAAMHGTGPCEEGNHTIIDDYRRSYDRRGDYLDVKLCDKHLELGWYRFLLNGSNAVIPSSCVPEYYCQTDAPMWLNLGVHSLPEVGQEIEARVCANWISNCCEYTFPITVHNCGNYFVYNIERINVCDLAYCAKPQN